MVDFAAIYWLVYRWHSEQLAEKTVWLVFLYPFSIFYRSYYSEGLFLLLLVVVMETLRTKKWFRAALAAGLLTVVRFVGLAAPLVMSLQLLKNRVKDKISLAKLIGYAGLSLIPLIVFMAYCYYQTGNPIYFIKASSEWFSSSLPVASTLIAVFHIWSLPWHSFHHSRVDDVSIVLFGMLIVFARRWLPTVWWRLALLLWLIPILTNDTMAASRFQAVNLPIFIFAAYMLKKRWQYAAVLSVSLVSLLAVAILFSNWVWIG